MVNCNCEPSLVYLLYYIVPSRWLLVGRLLFFIQNQSTAYSSLPSNSAGKAGKEHDPGVKRSEWKNVLEVYLLLGNRQWRKICMLVKKMVRLFLF